MLCEMYENELAPRSPKIKDKNHYIVRAHNAIAPFFFSANKEEAEREADSFVKDKNTTCFVHGLQERFEGHFDQKIVYSQRALVRINEGKPILNEMMANGLLSEDDISDIMNQMEVEIRISGNLQDMGYFEKLYYLGFVVSDYNACVAVLKAPLE